MSSVKKYLFDDYAFKVNQALKKVKQNEVDIIFSQIDERIGSANNIYLLGNVW